MDTMMFTHALAMVFMLLKTVNGVICPDGWLPYGSNCYLFDLGFNRKSWHEAKEQCKVFQGNLLNIETQEEYNWVINVTFTLDERNPGAQEFWVGLNNLKNPRVWSWTDEQPANMTLIRWGVGEPSDPLGSERCAEIWDRLFNDKNCDVKLDYICERESKIALTCNTDEGWQYYSGECYKLFNQPSQSFDDARNRCYEEESELLVTNSNQRQAAANHITRLFGIDVWIGLKENAQKNWDFVNGDKLTPSLVSYWQPGNLPQGQGQLCAAVNSSTLSSRSWYKAPCSMQKSFLCQKPQGLCPSGTFQHQSTCFDMRMDALPYQQAEDMCNKSGSTMLKLDKASDSHFIVQLLEKLYLRGADKVWLDSTGLTDGRCYFLSTYVPAQSGDTLSSPVRPSQEGRCQDYSAYICQQPVQSLFTSSTASTTTPIPTTTTTTTIALATAADMPSSLSPASGATVTSGEATVLVTTLSSNHETIQPKDIYTSKERLTSFTKSTLITTIAPISTTWDPVCGPFWRQGRYMTQFCYRYVDQMLTWAEARDKCQENGGTLLSIGSLMENYDILRLSPKSLVWTGGSTLNELVGFQWEDNSPVAFFDWADGEPSTDSMKECILMSTNTGQWSMMSCDDRNPSICKRPVFHESAETTTQVLTTLKAGQTYACDENWVDAETTCFLVVHNKTDWQQARTLCRSYGGDLASVGSEYEQSALEAALPRTHCYNIHNNDSHCTMWAEKGECQNNPVWMASNCQHACNLCVDECRNSFHDEDWCYKWANGGECYKNSQWMIQNCALSCGLCDAAIYSSFWIGLTDQRYQMIFHWVDGSEVLFTKWAQGEPNDFGQENEDCVAMYTRDGSWNDQSCASILPGYVCEKPHTLHTNTSFYNCPQGLIEHEFKCFEYTFRNISFNDAKKQCTERSGKLLFVDRESSRVRLIVTQSLMNKMEEQSTYLWLNHSDGPGKGCSVLSSESKKIYSGLTCDSPSLQFINNTRRGPWEGTSYELGYSCIYDIFDIQHGDFTLPTTVKPEQKVTLPAAFTCGKGWTEYNDYCYKIYGELGPVTWIQARSICRNHGAEMMSIYSREEDLFVGNMQINLGRLIWLGLNDRDNEGVLKWADGSPASYTNLDVKPSVGIDKQTSHYHDCVYQTIFPKLSWILEHCYSNHVMHAACKVPKGVPVDEIGTNTTVVGNIPICDEYGAEWKSFDNHCYYVHNNTFQQLTFHEALDQCQTMNSSLVSIHSLDENNFIVSLQKDMGIWLGLHILNSTELQWTDGSPVDFIHLAPRSLDSMYGVFRCVRMMPFFATGMWERANCNDLIVSFMCKKPREGADIIGPLVPGGATESKADEDDDKDKFCPSDFVSSHFGDKCYYVSQPNNYQTFLGAQKYCHDRLGAQAELVSIQSAIEQDFVLSLLGGMRYPAWIGLLYMYRIVYGYFTWANNEAVGYSKLLTSLLNKDMCAQILVNSTHAGQWSMVDCHAYLPFVCQTKKSSKYRSCASQQRPQENNATCAPSGTSCYKLLPDSLTRQMASSACQKDGGHLVSITTPFEQAFVNVVLRDLKQTPVWIGLKNMGNGLDMFAWDDGRPYGTFTAWESEFYRSTKRENCVQVIDQRWTNTNCDVKAQALCEYGPAPTHPPAVQCPEGSTMFERECYRVKVSDAVSWGRAVNACREVGMNLTSVHSEDEEKFLKDLWREEKMKVSNTNTQKFWIGLKHILPALEEGFWAWEDGTPMDFTKLDATRMWSWQRSQVIDEESCTLMSETPQVDWELARCDDDGAMFGYICKVSAQPVNKNENYDSRSGDVSTAKSGLPYTRHGASISSSDKDKILQGREIAGIVIGCLCVIAIVGGAIYMFIMRNHAHKQSYSPGSGFVNAMYRKSRDLAQEDEDSSERGSSEMDKSTMKLCDT